MKKWLLLILILVLFPSTARAEDFIRVVSLEAPPMVMEEDGQVSGMAAELALEGLERAGYEVELTLTPWVRAVYMAKHGLADALFYAVYNDDRAKLFYYPQQPLFTVDVVALKRTKARIVINSEYTGLNDWVLGKGRGFAYGPKVLDFVDRAHFKRVEEASSNDTNFKKLLDSRIDILLVDRVLARYFMEKPDSLGLTEIVKDEEGNIAVLDSMAAYLIFSKVTQEKQDADRFSEALKSMIEDGSYQTILNRYQ